MKLSGISEFNFDGNYSLASNGKIVDGRLKIGNSGNLLSIVNSQINGIYDGSGNFTPIGQISQRSFMNYLGNFNSVPLTYAKGNGINNLNFENYSPLDIITSADDLNFIVKNIGAQNGYDLGSFKDYVIPSFERVVPWAGLRQILDISEVAADTTGLWYLTGEFQNKLNNVIGNRGITPYILDLESGDTGPGFRSINETGDRVPIVFINSGYNLGQKITNPNVQSVFNIYTNNETAVGPIGPGPNNFGPTTYNIKLDFGDNSPESYHVDYNRNKDNPFYWFVQNLKARAALAPMDGGASWKELISLVKEQPVAEINFNNMVITKEEVQRISNLLVKR